MRSMNEKCAVVGIFDHPEASKLAYFSLHAQQHRGQEAAGISTSNGEKLYTIKDRGLVTQVFDNQKLAYSKRADGNRAYTLFDSR